MGPREGSPGTPAEEVTHLSWPGSTHTNFRSKVWILWPWKKMRMGVVQSRVYRDTCPGGPRCPARASALSFSIISVPVSCSCSFLSHPRPGEAPGRASLVQLSKALLAWGPRLTAEPDTSRFTHLSSHSMRKLSAPPSHPPELAPSTPHGTPSCVPLPTEGATLLRSRWNVPSLECYHLPSGPSRPSLDQEVGRAQGQSENGEVYETAERRENPTETAA